MADIEQCSNCGAILGPKDDFCAECGAPRPPKPEASEGAPTAEAPALPPPSAPPPASPAGESDVRWRVAMMVLLVLGALACVAGLVAFVLFALIESEGYTTMENWLFSAVCCLFPIGGAGAIMAIVGVTIWYSRLRKP